MRRATLAASLLVIGSIAAGYSVPSASTVPITTRSSRAREYYLKGRDLAEKIRTREATEYFKKAVEADSSFALARLSLAFSDGGTASRFKEIEKAKSLSAGVSEGERLMILAAEAAFNGDAARQRMLLKQLVTAYPDDERAHNMLANQYFSQQDYRLAIDEYQRALAIDPEFSQPYNQLGYSYRFLDDYDRAEQSFKKYIELIPDDPNPYDSYAELLLEEGKFNESIKWYQKALAVNDQFIPSMIGIATNLMLQGKYSAAIDQCERVERVAEGPVQKVSGSFTRMLVFLHKGDFKTADKIADEMYLTAKKNKLTAMMIEDLAIRSQIAAETGDIALTESLYGKIGSLIDTGSLPARLKYNYIQRAHYFKARLALLKDDLSTARQEAAEFRRTALESRSPGQIRQAHELAGIIALATNDYSGAITELNQADQRDPYNLYRLGQAYKASGDNQRAKEYYERAAHFNGVSSFSFALVRNKALKALELLKS